MSRELLNKEIKFMDWNAIFDTIKAAKKLLKFAFWLGKLTYFVNYYFRSPIRVIIFGESGTGKTHFINSLLHNPLTKGRTRLTEQKKLILKNGRKIVFYDTPGHQTLQEQRYKISEFISKKKITGIINVVSYGYNESDTADGISIFKVGTDEVKEEYLKENRKREISQLDDWMRYINSDNKVRWIITIINKADIWYENKSNVLSYYEEGEYAKALVPLGHCCMLYSYPYCSVISPFCDRPMILYMGERQKVDMCETLTSELINIVKTNGKIKI